MAKTKPQKRLLYGVAIAASVTLLAGILSAWNPLNKWQLKLTNRLYTADSPSQDIVIVGIGEDSLNEENGLGRWDQWDRLFYKRVVENLEDKGAAVIGFDILFAEKSKGISEKSLKSIFKATEAMEEKLEAYLDESHPSDLAFGETVGRYDNIFFINKGRFNRNNLIRVSAVTEPIGVIKENAKTAWNIVFSDEDDLVRRIHPEFYNEETQAWEKSFSLAIAEAYKGQKIKQGSDPNAPFLINYQAPPYRFKEIPFLQAYNGFITEEDIKGKIVLIGATAERLKDSFPTPTSSDIYMPGVEIHANAIQTLLEGKFLREQSTVSQIATMALLTALLVALVMVLGILPGLGAATLTIALYLLAAKPVFDRGLILNLVYPTIALFFAYLATTLYKYLVETREKSRLGGAFAKYVNKDLVQKILDDPDALKLGGAKRTITAFFSDIANFTHFSENASPEGVVEQLNEYFDVMVGIIFKNKGTVNKFEGDAIMAFWGAPLDQPDHAVLAAQSALECRAALKTLHARWQQEGKPLLDFRIGLSSGEAIAGNMGSRDRLEYTVMGDIVNLGSRLEAANKVYGTHIMLSGETQALLGDAFELRTLDRLRVKGKDQPVDVYELITPAGRLTDAQKQVIATFHEAMEYYRNAKFDDAIARFNQVAIVWPQDGPTQTYLKRCADLKAAPPAQGWDGTWTLTSK